MRDAITLASATGLVLLSVGLAGARPNDGNVRFVGHDEVQAAFAKGMPLIEVGDYKIHASRRVEAGEAEVHTRDTDIIYVIEGSVSFVTGGTVVDPKNTGPDEIRGTRLEGGTARALNKGDVIVVPAGVPHRFSQVDETFLYFVVKASASDSAGGTR